MSYQQQYKEIKALLKSIDGKSKGFTKRADPNHTHFGDLLYVISQLKELDEFLK